jgi:dihydroneopterin aldolase
MDKIILKNLAFYGYHGAMSEENVLGQKFFVDLELGVDLKTAGKSDRVEDTVHYGMVYDVVKGIIEGPAINLIEAVAEQSIEAIFKEFDKVMTIKMTLKKPEAPVAGIFDYFAVELYRER